MHTAKANANIAAIFRNLGLSLSYQTLHLNTASVSLLSFSFSIIMLDLVYGCDNVFRRSIKVAIHSELSNITANILER